jgi:hypothetical protein
MAALSSICTRCCLLESGRLVAAGETSSVIGRYLSSDRQNGYEAAPAVVAGKHSVIQRAWIENAGGQTVETGSPALRVGEEFTLKARLHLRAEHAVEFIASFYDSLRRPLWSFSHTLFKITPLQSRGEFEVSLRYRLPRLNVSLLTIDLAITAPNTFPALDMVLDALTLPVAGDSGTVQVSGSELFPMLVEPEYSAAVL